MTLSSVKFGTSGLRGLAADMTPALCQRYVTAFLKHIESIDQKPKAICIGIDKRPSSLRIAADCARAAKSLGMEVTYLGLLPTPALALHALSHKMPAVMVTGSHNPEDQNGLKFYLSSGEFRKKDEAPVLAIAEALELSDSAGTEPLSETLSAKEAYVARFTGFFAPDTLQGLRLGVDMHSAAGSPLVVAILQALGAECVITRRSDKFVAVDTEAIEQDYLDLARSWITEHRLDAIVSTDGDGDRPLVIDETGTQIGGDVLGILASHALEIENIVTPVSSTTAIERTGWFCQIGRTQIGSPYVIAAMEEMAARGTTPVAGFEANGGFLTAGTINRGGKSLGGLTTRDAMLPMIACLEKAAMEKTSLSALVAELPTRVMLSGRLKDYSRDTASELVTMLIETPEARSSFLPDLADVTSTDLTDGARMTTANDIVIHFRPSGNAAELRCYVEASERAIAKAVLDRALQAARLYGQSTTTP